MSQVAPQGATDDDLEITILQVKQAFVCRVPPLSSSEGHRAENWDRTAIWDGRLRIVVKGKQLSILLEHTKGREAGTLFAACPVSDDPRRRSVEPVIDSSRYFVLRLEDGKGRHAFMGLFFASREEAFDFKCALQHQQTVAQEEEKTREFVETLNSSSKDYSIPSGHTISLNLKKDAIKTKKAAQPEDDEDAFTIAAPPPPPPAGKKKKPKQVSQSAPAAPAPAPAPSQPQFEPGAADPFGDDNWTDFVDASAVAASHSSHSSQSSQANSSNSSNQDWVDFS